MIQKALIGLLVVTICICALVIAEKVHAQTKLEQQEVAPYEFAELPDANNVKVYKLVHQGCEIFVVYHKEWKYADTVGIATGRGCK